MRYFYPQKVKLPENPVTVRRGGTVLVLDNSQAFSFLEDTMHEERNINTGSFQVGDDCGNHRGGLNQVANPVEMALTGGTWLHEFFEAKLHNLLGPGLAAVEVWVSELADGLILDPEDIATIRFLAAIIVFQGLAGLSQYGGLRQGEE